MPLRNIGGVNSTTINVLAGSPVCQYVVVGGGGNGGSSYAGYGTAGGGAGGVINGSGFVPVIGSTYAIVVGGGGGNNSSIANSLIAYINSSLNLKLFLPNHNTQKNRPQRVLRGGFFRLEN